MKEKDLDHKIQEWLDAGMQGSAPERNDPSLLNDLQAYNTLFEALREKTTGPSYSFSFNVIRKIKTRNEYKRRFIWNLLLPAAIVLAIAVIYVVALVFGNKAAIEAIALLVALKGPLLFALCCFLIIQYLDGALIKRRHAP